MLTFEQAIFEAFQFITPEKTRYDLNFIQVEEHRVAATDGKRLYVAYPDGKPPVVGYLKLAQIKDGKHRYPRPRQQSANQGSKLIQADGKEYLETLGTRFHVVKTDIKFPPYERIIPREYIATVLDRPELFVAGLRSLYQHGKTIVQEHLFGTGDKITPKYRAVIYKNGALHLVTECCFEAHGNYLPVAHTKLATVYGCADAAPVLAVFNPEFYPRPLPLPSPPPPARSSLSCLAARSSSCQSIWKRRTHCGRRPRTFCAGRIMLMNLVVKGFSMNDFFDWLYRLLYSPGREHAPIKTLTSDVASSLRKLQERNYERYLAKKKNKEKSKKQRSGKNG